jgi:hypothetical protein
MMKFLWHNLNFTYLRSICICVTGIFQCSLLRMVMVSPYKDCFLPLQERSERTTYALTALMG